jgi:NADPH:quinone reductase
VRAARVVRHGEPGDVVEVHDVPAPEVPPGAVRVEMRAASLNYGDIARCRGGVASVMAEPPFTLGMDVCGTVEAAGDGAEGWLGKRVVGITAMAMGGLAELAVVPASGLFDAPPELDDAEAAGFLLPYHVAHLALHRRAKLQAGETLLVTGAASGVGSAAVQLGAAAGARVLALTGPGKGQAALDMGAHVAIDHAADDVFEAVMDATDGRGAEVVLDVVGGDLTETLWSCVAREGRYLPVGFNDDPVSGMTGRPLRKVSTGNFSVVGVLLAYTELPRELRRMGLNPFGPADGQQVHDDLLKLVAAGTVRPLIGRRIGLAEVGAALDDHAARRSIGRTVAEVGR